LVEQRGRRKGLTLDVRGQLGQGIGCGTQPAQLVGQVGGVGGALLGGVQRRGRLHRGADLWPVHQFPLQHQRLTRVGGNLHAQRLLVHRRRGFGVDAHHLVQLGVVAAPEQVAGPDAAEVDRAVAEMKFQLAPALRRHLVDAPALLLLLRAAPVRRVEDHAVARLERRSVAARLRRDDDAGGRHLRHLAHEHAAVAGRPPAHHRLVVRAGDEIRAQPAREDLLQPQFLLAGDAQRQPGTRFVHGLAIGGGGQRHVVSVLVAPLDLERRHPQLHDLRHLVERVEVAG
jgi:hypothetical protein